jgi:hypothetical protein
MKYEDISTYVSLSYITGTRIGNSVKNSKNMHNITYNEPIKQYSFWKLGMMLNEEKQENKSKAIDAIFKAYF